MRLPGFLVVLSLSVSGAALAEEHPACLNVDFEYRSYSAAKLRVIAESCNRESMEELYYHRAYHADLAEQAGTFTSLTDAHGIDRGEHFRSYRMYLALIEEFSQLWYPIPRDRIVFLNREYERWGNVAELRLRGYDRLANRVESGAGLP